MFFICILTALAMCTQWCPETIIRVLDEMLCTRQETISGSISFILSMFQGVLMGDDDVGWWVLGWCLVSGLGLAGVEEWQCYCAWLVLSVGYYSGHPLKDGQCPYQFSIIWTTTFSSYSPFFIIVVLLFLFILFLLWTAIRQMPMFWWNSLAIDIRSWLSDNQSKLGNWFNRGMSTSLGSCMRSSFANTRMWRALDVRAPGVRWTRGLRNTRRKTAQRLKATMIGLRACTYPGSYSVGLSP